MGFHRAMSIEASTRVANGVGIGATKASRRSRCPLMLTLKVYHYRGKPRSVIALTTTKITRQLDIVSISQATACRQILWSDGPWTGKEIEPAWENHYKSRGYKPTATCKKCGFKKLCVLPSLTPTEVPPSPPSPPPSWCCLKCVSPEGCVRAQGRRPEPTMTNWGNASKTCASIRKAQPSTTDESYLPSAKGAGTSQISGATKEQ